MAFRMMVLLKVIFLRLRKFLLKEPQDALMMVSSSGMSKAFPKNFVLACSSKGSSLTSGPFEGMGAAFLRDCGQQTKVKRLVGLSFRESNA